MAGKCGQKLTFTGTSPKNPPKYCYQWPMRGKTKCRLHGGKQERGKAEIENYMPARIVENYERLLQDPQILSLQREIAWQRAYYQDLQKRAHDGAIVAPVLFDALDRLDTAWSTFRRVSTKESTKKQRLTASELLTSAMRAVQSARHGAQTEDAVSEKLMRMWTVLGNLTDKESKQLERLHNMVTLERALSLQAAAQKFFIEAMEQYVPDRHVQMEIRRRIAGRLAQFIGRGSTQDLGATGGSETPVAVDTEANNG